MSKGRPRCAQGHALSDYQRPCRTCRRAQVIAAVTAADASLTRAQIDTALDTALPTGAALRSITAALAANPDSLGDGAPPAVGRLVGALIAAGSATLVRPACASCARTDRPLTRSPQGGVCTRCRHRQTATACATCDVVKPVAGRDAGGNPICEACRRRSRGQRPCGRCGQVRTIARRAREGEPDVCTSCYRLPSARCSRCGRHRPCHFAAADRPVCKACTPRATSACARCGADRPPTVRWPEGPVCEPCYRAALQARGTCAGCGQTRRLVDPVGAQATHCTDCAAAAGPAGHVCGDCGVEDRLFERGRCARCALTRRTRALLTDPATGDLPAALAPIAAVITAAPQPYSALNWLRTGAGATILADLAA